MIVKCEQCQTRFKIPDDKATDKGVKVRCTKCQHTFRVKRDGAAVGGEPTPAPVASKSTEPDPFAKFGAGQPDLGEVTRPAAYAMSPEAGRQTGAPLQP